MKSVVFIAAALISVCAQAQVVETSIKSGKFHPEHVRKAQGGRIEINYNKKTVKLVVNRGWSCPEGRMCAMVMPGPFEVELPIVNVKVSEVCNIRTVTAAVDKRPVDGILEKIVVEDYSDVSCRFVR